MSSMIPQYDTKLMTDIFDDSGTFLYYYHNRDLPEGEGIPATISDASAKTLYYLLVARYGNNPIANFDENQFRFKMFSIIYQYGPTWEKRLDVQNKLRALTDDQLRLGSKAMFNHAFNPTEIPANTESELSFINEQNTTKYTKSPLEGYAVLEELLKTDVTGEFLNKFQRCFKQFVRPERTWIYVTEGDD